MEPQRNSRATLVDLLDRILDKGLVIHADLVVSVAGIPLIGVNLRAALAGIETMRKYGMMQTVDERTRARERKCRSKKASRLLQGEAVILKMPGAYYSNGGIYTAWRYGHLYLTNKRLLLWHADFGEILFETSLEKIRRLVIRRRENFAGKKEKELCLVLEGDKVARLSASDTDRLHAMTAKRMKALRMDETETCPQCGRRVLMEELSCRGCPRCGWASLKVERAVTE